ncbi:SusC/RagA family TonB-linked outer membrane protein [Paludibacter propionicigenes]|nr:TonB-dependent receptor [Paludibacter propionicigenes]
MRAILCNLISIAVHKLAWIKPSGKLSTRGNLLKILFLIFICSTKLVAGNETTTPSVPASEIKVSGKIVDNEGYPMPGATVAIKGKATGVITQSDGTYSISVPSESSVLEFSFIGYTKQQFTVGSRTVFNVVMKPDATLLNELVVVGYAVEQKALLTGSVGVVNSETLNKIPVSTIDGVLQGQTSGLQVTQNSGTPGAAMSVRIRGVSSVSGSNQPLYVIDGIPVTTGDYAQIGYEGQGTNALSDLNPSDIESVTVLKDAAAASIYGARATNGVVVITTKRGKSQKSTLSVNLMHGVQQVGKKLKMLDARGWMEYSNDLAGSQRFTQSQMDNITVNTNWQDVIFRTAPTTKVELSVAGGNEKTKFYISGDYFQQDGILKGTDYNRLNSRLNLDHSLTDKISIGASLGISYAKTDRVEGDQSTHGVLPNGISTPAIFPVYNADGSYNQSGPYSNAISIVDGATNQNFSFRTIGNTFLNYNIIPGLTFSTKWGIDFLNFREHAFEYNTVQGKKYNGLGFEAYNNVMNAVSNNTLKYHFSLKKHDFDILAGYSFEKKQNRYSFTRAQDYPDENLQYTVSAATIVQSYANALDEGTESFFGRLNYNYDNKYIASFSGRGDASSKFGPNNRWGFFPSASLAWRLAEEKWLNLPKQISELKIRTSYGLTGNDDITPFLYKELYGVTAYNEQSGYYPTGIPNPNLKWETTAQFNVGLDLSLFNNRITLTVDYYNKQTKDLLLDRLIPESSGYSSVIENIGRVENKGFEFNLSTVNLDGAFKWTTVFNLSANRNKVLELYNNKPIDNIGRGGNRVMVGQPIGIFYNYKWLGIDPSTGDCVYADLNKNGRVDADDRTIVGNPQPDFIGGITNTFNYKGFDLSIFLQFSYGNDVFNGSRLYLESLTGGDNQLESVTRRWKNVGDITDIPRATSDATATANNRRASSRFIEDGSYLRIKNVNLGYTLKKEWIKKFKLENLRVYVTAQNLFTFTHYSGLDPEVNYVGNDNSIIGTDFFTYPQARSYNFGVNIKF